MSKLLYSVTMSLDAFIAGPGGDMSWLTEFIEPNPAADALVNEIGAILVGRRSFGGDDPHRGTEAEGKPFGGGWEGPQLVLTHNPPADSVPGITFVNDFEEAVEAARAAAGDKMVNIIGADVARQCIEAGWLDEVAVFIAPVLLGDGVRLFAHPGGATVKLRRIDENSAPLANYLRFSVLR
ncbi:MAG: dihydrofolate reductase [Hamadaea sp.]|uniref:dihydrofolate reductase family protein n=1 Tax=Hamadaea sp. TaxID=2024425 RepID=UPI00184E3490|nr:dihydrofolate reductase family protein [Hamadaea sp.]NUR73705.1 dihydrofolate reductase [Hamadaea sp.]NUT22555.1 dihydrofolate reductase [Hamadaea sp.]